jgi:ribonuclease D
LTIGEALETGGSAARPASPPPADEIELIADAAGLQTLISRLEREPVVALDTEGNSFHAYVERVCLIQLGLPDRQVLVDPLNVDVRPLGPLLADRSRLWVLHGSDFDVRTLHRDFGFRLGRLFDTMVAAQTLKLPELGLAALLKRNFGVDLRKGEQRSDWGKRPLTPPQRIYAAADVRWLLPLHGRLAEALTTEGAAAKAQAQFEKLRVVVARERHFDPEGYRRLKGARGLDAKGQALLRAFWCAREEMARELNRPPFKVVSEATMVEVARTQPGDLVALRKLSGVSDLVTRRIGPLLVPAAPGDAAP